MKTNLSKIAKQLGKRGGDTTAALYGKEHFSKAGKKGGWPKGKKRKLPEQEVG